MTRLFLIGLASLFALTFNAHALSCMQPDPARSVHWMQENGEPPIIAVGDIEVFHGSLNPDKLDDTNNRVGTEAHGYFSGKIYGPNDVMEIHNLYVKVNVSCFGPWCGGGPLNGPLLLLETIESDGNTIHTLNLGPCGGNVFALPTDGDLMSKLQKQLKDPSTYQPIRKPL